MEKPIAVREYSRKDGTAVRSHGRRKLGRFTVATGWASVVPRDPNDPIYDFNTEWANGMYKFSTDAEAWAKADQLNAMTPDELAREFEKTAPFTVGDIMEQHGCDEEEALDMVACVLQGN